MPTQEITKVQELIHTTRVEAVMASDVITATPSMSMEEVKALLRSKHITGVPVVEGDRLVGMISMSDVLRAMEDRSMSAHVRDRMTLEVKSVLKDSLLVEVVNHLGPEGFGRLPVVSSNGQLVGIVTTGTMIRSLLREMDISFQQKEAERLQAYRASHIFQDVLSDDSSLILRYTVNEHDFSSAGQAASMIKKSLQRLGVIPATIRRVSVAVYEAEMNLVIHTDVGGEITAEVRRSRLKISAVDHGPGIEDLEKVLQPGYSTAPQWIRDMGFGAGMGLANIRRCSDVMALTSAPGAGTRLDMQFRF